MHTINLNEKNIRTDLITEQNNKSISSKETIINGVKIINSRENNNLYTTIYFEDITDKDNYKNIEKILIKELKEYITPTRKNPILIIGLGNRNSTPDSLGPKVIDNILVTRYLFLLGDVEKGYSNTCSFIPNVTGNTGIETASIIKSLINEINPSQVLIIDALKTDNKEKLNRTIQITNTGIHPGSGIGNTRKEISSHNMNTKVIAIGVPTVVEIDENLIVCTADIDYLIEKLSHLISSSVNKLLHENFIRQNN
jgi:spore protease